VSDEIKLQGPTVALVAPVNLTQACHALPAFRAIANARADLSPVIVCPKGAVPFWSLHFSELLPYDESTSANKLVTEFTDFAPHSAVVWEDSSATRALGRLQVPQRIGSADPALSKIVTDPIPVVEPLGPPRHRLARYLDLAEALHCEPRQAVNFDVPPLPLAPKVPKIALAPDSDLGPAAQWPGASFQKLVQLLSEGREVEFTVLALPGNTTAAQELSALLEIEAIEAPELGDLLATLPTFSTLVASDGTLPHIAASVGLPTVTLMGPRSVAVHRPPGTIHEPLSTFAECSPCNLASCPLDHRCLNELTPETVAEATFKLLKAREATS
jgi:ADP-heptose:LPS heptosyltransferase